MFCSRMEMSKENIVVAALLSEKPIFHQIIVILGFREVNTLHTGPLTKTPGHCNHMGFVLQMSSVIVLRETG